MNSEKQVVGVVGLGYVGLPLSLVFAEGGHSVIGFDVDRDKALSLNNGTSYIRHISSSRIVNVEGRFSATNDFSKIKQCDAVIICVPTPLGEHREPDLSFVLNTGKLIGENLKKGALVVLESTTYPGTTEGPLKQVIEESSGGIAGKDFYLAYSPEREDPGNPDSQVKSIPKVVGGMDEISLEKVKALYSSVINELVPVSSCSIAEATKLTENIFRSVNIALVNELKVVYEKMGIDVWEVIDAAKTKPFGFMPFYPGPGLGGHCIPIDPFYLTWKAKEFGEHTKFVELAGQVNTSMPDYVVSKVMEVLNQFGKAVRGARILILGLAYKPNVDDDRESPSYILMEKLEAMGGKIEFNDPFIPVIPPTREHAEYEGRKSVEITEDYDLLLLATNHDEYESFDFSQMEVPFIDTRSCLNKRPKNYFKA